MVYRRHRDGASLTAALLCTAGILLGSAAAAQTRGGQVTLGVEQDIAGFDPLVVGIYDTGALASAALLFDTLTRIDDQGKVQPRLALSWSASADLKTWTFKLRPGVKFQDGSPFNAQAVAFNYQRMMNPDNHCRCAFFLVAVASVEAADDLTVVFHLRIPAADFSPLLSPPASVNVFHSPKAIQEFGSDYNRHPVGTGPFKLKSWQAGDRLVLERNPDYWDEGHPYLDQVVVRPLPDPGTRFASLLAGDVDIIWDDITDDVVRARESASLKVNDYVGSGVGAIVFNLKTPALADVRVRQALRYAIDMQALSDNLDHGIRKPARDPFGQGSFVQCGDTGVLPYDPAKAIALLKEHGEPVELKAMVTAEPRGMALGLIFQEFWKNVGVAVTLDPVDQTTFVTKSFQHAFEIGGWRIVDLADPDPQLYADFHTGSPVNIASYSNPEVDRLLDDARGNGDRGKRVEDYCRIARILNREVPWIWGLENRYFSIAKAALRGVHRQYSDTVDVADAWWEKK
jgi:peptide/nickel transport system substrate-binding protein